jgi:hypothetical protein
MQNKELKTTIDLLEKRKLKLAEDMKSIDNVIKSLQVEVISEDKVNEATSVDDNKPDDYDPTWTSKNKVLYFIKAKNRFLHFRELATLIGDAENLNPKELKKLSEKLSASCQSIKKNRTIVKFQAGAGNTSIFWGSPKWLDSNGKPLPEHDIDRNFILGPHFEKQKVNINL